MAASPAVMGHYRADMPSTPPPASPSTKAHGAAGLSVGFSKEDTAIIFDWDDTLLSSSWLSQNGLRLDEPAEVPAEAQEQLEVLQNGVIALLNRASEFGTCVIITNAETGWVELSCKKFMPRVVPMLARLKVLSARSTFETFYPDSPTDWKVQAFYQEIQAVYAGRSAGCKRNVISFGDSVYERLAVHKVTSAMGPATRTKSVKFVERPTVEQLVRQVELVHYCFEAIALHNGCLDLMLTIQVLYNSENGGGGGGLGAGLGGAGGSKHGAMLSDAPS